MKPGPKKHAHIPQVAILLRTSQTWGRRILKGILAYANEVGPWHVWINSESPSSLKHLPKGWRGDGIIARVDDLEFANEIRASGLPFVNVSDNPEEIISAPRVCTDDEAGTQMAAQHFVDRGLRHIGFVGPTHTPNPIFYQKAFRKALQGHDLDCISLELEINEPDNTERLSQWLVGLPKPIGILAWGHGFARQVVDCCMESGISVPHDVSVLGGSYDELFSHACFPALSGLLAPTESIGYHSARLLHRMMQGEEVAHDITRLPPRGIKECLSTDNLAVDDPKLVKVIEYIRENAFESISMTDILDAVPMARRSLERRFKQAFGRSPTDEIRRIRINRARELLVETDLQMQEIAENCGYASYNYLTHMFKQSTGLSPRDYRNQFKTRL